MDSLIFGEMDNFAPSRGVVDFSDGALKMKREFKKQGYTEEQIKEYFNELIDIILE